MITATNFSIGDQPGNGCYRCVKCGQYVARLLGPEEQLPPCEICGSSEGVFYRPEDKEATQSHGPI